MTTFDFAPFYSSTVGFDRMFEKMDRSARGAATTSWPPYNIEKVDNDAYQISLAVAGFEPDEIELVQNDTQLLVTGQKNSDESERQFLYRGIAARQFQQTFNLADHVKVTGAALQNGLLTIELVREVPEALKPRRIAIGDAGTAAPRLKAA